MNHIHPPLVDDIQVYDALADNNRLKSFPRLQPIAQNILQAYLDYVAQNGDAHQINTIGIPKYLEDYLVYHYEKPPNSLCHIPELRTSTEHCCCPMCGSMHSGTLDHLLPKRTYPEFSIFSQNLVPACKCNTKRGEVLLGAFAGERILHPYFDQCLERRLIAANFKDLGAIPAVSLKLLVDRHDPLYKAISFHVKTIVERTAIKNYLSDRWIKFCRKPSLVIRDFSRRIANANSLKNILDNELLILDEVHGGKNNWNSVFVAGLLEEPVSTWIFQQISKPGYIPNAKII